MSKNKLFVGNLTYSVRDSDLQELFSRYGEVISVNVLEQRGYGFVEMGSPEAAKKARDALSEKEFQGRKLLIDGVIPFIPSERRAGKFKSHKTGSNKDRFDRKESKLSGPGSHISTPATSWTHEKRESGFIKTERSDPEKRRKQQRGNSQETRGRPPRSGTLSSHASGKQKGRSGRRDEKKRDDGYRPAASKPDTSSGIQRQNSQNRDKPGRSSDKKTGEQRTKKYWPLETGKKGRRDK